MNKVFKNWNLQHSLFIKIGGFTLKSNTTITSGRQIVERGAKLDHSICEQLLEFDISDKSKADSVSNFLINLQTTRFLLEIIARGASSLPIPPLENLTCAHIFCAMIVRIFWQHKPNGPHVR